MSQPTQRRSSPPAAASPARVRAEGPSTADAPPGGWTFLTNHAHVLLCVAQNAEARVRDVALAVGITERAVQRILGELEEQGILARERRGRRNHYRVHAEGRLRHPLEAHRTVADLLQMLRSDG